MFVRKNCYSRQNVIPLGFTKNFLELYYNHKQYFRNHILLLVKKNVISIKNKVITIFWNHIFIRDHKII